MTRMLAYFLLLNSLAMTVYSAERPSIMAPADGDYTPGPLTARGGSPRPPRLMTARARDTSSGKLVAPAPEAPYSDSASEPEKPRRAWETESTRSSSSDHATPDNTRDNDPKNRCIANSIICGAGSGMCAVFIYVAYIGMRAFIEQQEASGSSDLG